LRSFDTPLIAGTQPFHLKTLMSNTFDSDLSFSIMAATGITVLGNALAPLRVFTSDFSSDVVKPRSTVNVPVYTTASAVQTNPTNFETGDTTAENAQVVLNHYSKSFHITSDQLNNGHKLENLIKINAQFLADKVLGNTFSNLLSSNYSTSTATGSAFNSTELQKAWGDIKGNASQKGIVLKDSLFAKFLPTNMEAFDPTKMTGVYGFGNGFTHASDFSAAESGVLGFVCTPGAMAIASAIPQKTDLLGNSIISEIVEIPELGMSFELNLWGSTGSRSAWGSLDVCFGSAVADTTALKIIK
jgi:hypothetical protein